MRKKRDGKRKKRAKIETANNEAAVARLEAAKLKREETMAIVKRRLDEKFRLRNVLTHSELVESERARLLQKKTPCPVEKMMMEIREEMKTVITAGVEKVHAAKILGDRVKFDAKSSTMTISGKKYKIQKNVHAVGWGREALMLSSALEKIIGDNLKTGFLIVPRRTVSAMFAYPELFPKLNTHIHITEAQSDEIPDDVCARATKNIADYCKKLKKKDILIVVLSRNSNDLLCLPGGTTQRAEKMLVLDLLREAGASEQDIEIVRTTLSAIRGGRLATLAHPAKVLSLIMSDLGAQEIHLKNISGGPTIKMDHRASLSMARNILDKYDLHAHKLSHGIREILTDHGGSSRNGVEVSFESFVDNYIVASSKDSIEEMAITVFRQGYVPIKITGTSIPPLKDMSTRLRQISKDYTRLVSLMILLVEDKITRTEMYQNIRENIVSLDLTENPFVYPHKRNWARGLYLLISPPSDFMTNRTRRNGSRDFAASSRTENNQELAIYFSLDWYLRVQQYPILGEYVVWFLGGASDGRDGNTKDAGAYGYGNLAVDVYRKFNTREAYESSGINDVVDEDPWEEQRAIHESILPHNVLLTGNANLFFRNVNAGAELLKLGDVHGCTHTKVGDLHLIRIVHSQCSCSPK